MSSKKGPVIKMRVKIGDSWKDVCVIWRDEETGKLSGYFPQEENKYATNVLANALEKAGRKPFASVFLRDDCTVNISSGAEEDWEE